MKKIVTVLIVLLVATAAQAASWINFGVYGLSPSSTSASIDIGEKPGKIGKLRFQIDGQTVHFKSMIATPIKGQPITLHIPEFLKSGESSGLITLPGNATTLQSLTIEYSITTTTSTPAKLSLRIKPD